MSSFSSSTFTRICLFCLICIYHLLQFSIAWKWLHVGQTEAVCALPQQQAIHITPQQCEDILVFQHWSKWSKVFQNISHTFFWNSKILDKQNWCALLQKQAFILHKTWGLWGISGKTSCKSKININMPVQNVQQFLNVIYWVQLFDNHNFIKLNRSIENNQISKKQGLGVFLQNQWVHNTFLASFFTFALYNSGRLDRSVYKQGQVVYKKQNLHKHQQYVLQFWNAIYWMYSGRLDRSVYKQGQVICPTVECTVEKGDMDPFLTGAWVFM